MMKFVLYSVVYLAACSLSFGVSDSLKMQIHRTDGKVVEEVVKLEKIGKDTFRLKISHKKFPRNGSSTPYSLVKYVDFIHDDASAKKGDDGYWVLAEGFFGKFTRDDGFYELRRNKIPIYGVKKGDEAFVAIVKGLRWEYSSCVKVADGKYTIFPRFHISQIGMPIYEDIVIDFTYFKGENADYSAMGRAYRDYQLSRGEVLPLKERIKGNPRLAYSVDSPFLKFRMASFMRECETGLNRGFHWDNNDAPNIQIHRNFDNMMDTLRKLKKMGIDKADIILTNWNCAPTDAIRYTGSLNPNWAETQNAANLRVWQKSWDTKSPRIFCIPKTTPFLPHSTKRIWPCSKTADTYITTAWAARDIAPVSNRCITSRCLKITPTCSCWGSTA